MFPKGFELVILLILVLVLFGPRNLPKLGSAIGKATKNLRDGMGAGKKKKAEEQAAKEAAAEDDAPVAGATGASSSASSVKSEEITVEAEELPAAGSASGDSSTGKADSSEDAFTTQPDAEHKKRVVRVVKKSE